MRMTEVDDNVETKLGQQISQVPGVAQVTIGGSRSRLRIQLDPGEARGQGLSLEDVTHAALGHHRRRAQGRRSAQRPRSCHVHTNDQLVRPNGLERTSSSLPRWRSSAGARYRSGRDGAAGHQASGLGRWQSPASFLVIFKQRAPTSSNIVDKIMAELPRIKGIDAADARHLHPERRTQTIRALRPGRAIPLLLTVALVRDGDFRFSCATFGRRSIPECRSTSGLTRRLRLMWLAATVSNTCR